MAKQVVFIIAQNNFRDEELLEPKRILEDRGIKVKVASGTRKQSVGSLGTEIKPDLALLEIVPEEFDGIVFVGGAGATQFFYDTNAYIVARKFLALNKILGAISFGPSILGNAGLLIGKRVTGFPTEEENLISRGAEYTGMQTEHDGRFITAKDPSASLEFGEKLAFELGG